MEKTDELKDLNRRNTLSVELVLKEMTINIQNQQIRMDQMINTIGSMSQRLTILENLLILEKVRNTGTGPSVRERD